MVRVEKFGVVTAFFVVTVVRGENHKRVLSDSLIAQFCEDSTHIAVHPCNHRGLAFVWIRPIFVLVNSVAGNVLTIASSTGSLVVGVRNIQREVKEKWIGRASLFIEPFEGFLDYQIVGVINSPFWCCPSGTVIRPAL